MADGIIPALILILTFSKTNSNTTTDANRLILMPLGSPLRGPLQGFPYGVVCFEPPDYHDDVFTMMH